MTRRELRGDYCLTVRLALGKCAGFRLPEDKQGCTCNGIVNVRHACVLHVAFTQIAVTYLSWEAPRSTALRMNTSSLI